MSWGSRGPLTCPVPVYRLRHSNPYCATALSTFIEILLFHEFRQSCTLLKGRNNLVNIHYLCLYKELVRREQVSFSGSYFVNRQSQKWQFLWFEETGLLMESDAYLEFKWKGDQFLILFLFFFHAAFALTPFPDSSASDVPSKCTMWGMQVSLKW